MTTHAYREADPTATPLCGATDATMALEWPTGSVVLPAQVSCRQCRWVAGGGTGPAPERPDRLTPGLGHDGDIETRFTYHPPTPEQPEVYELIRDLGHLAALLVEAATFPSRERALAITELEAAVMWANAAIARRGLSDAAHAGATDLFDHALDVLRVSKPGSALLSTDPAHWHVGPDTDTSAALSSSVAEPADPWSLPSAAYDVTSLRGALGVIASTAHLRGDHETAAYAHNALAGAPMDYARAEEPVEDTRPRLRLTDDQVHDTHLRHGGASVLGSTCPVCGLEPA